MKAWNLYTTNEIKPSGWLRRQLEIQANGLSGNLYKVWRDVRDSAWIGGQYSSWERVPYWLDGFIPLAYLLEDEEMIATAKRYVDGIIERQKPDGWICPCEDDARAKYDAWAVILISKTLTVYYDCSRDERIPDVIYKVMKNFYELLSAGTIKLFDWGQARSECQKIRPDCPCNDSPNTAPMPLAGEVHPAQVPMASSREASTKHLHRFSKPFRQSHPFDEQTFP